MSRILVKGTQINVPNTVGAASSFSEATVVRLVNTTTDARLVTVAEDNSGTTTIGTFTILGSASELVEKNPTNVVFVDSGTNVKGAKVGFTN
jgi:hypothetical protein